MPTTQKLLDKTLRLALLALLVGASLWPLAARAQVASLDVTELLKQRYGLAWAADADERARWTCPEGRMDKPSGKVRYNWICTRADPRFMRIIVWRQEPAQNALVERDNFRAMAGGKDAPHGEPDCSETPYQHPAAALSGSVKACRLPLSNGNFYAAFAHVEVGASALSFVVRNASAQGSTARVKDDLLSWLESLKPVSQTENKE